MSQYQAVLFDLDGTLLDTYALILDSMRHCTTEVLGEEYPESRLMCGVGTPLAAQMATYSDDPAVQQALLHSFRTFNEAAHDERVRPFEGVVETIAALHELGLPLGVVTSKRHALAAHGLELFGMLEKMSCVIGPDDFPEHKPKPGPVRHACELLGIKPEEALYVGDSPFDMQAGNGAGCPTVAVTYGMFPRERLEAENPTFIIDSACELLDLVR